MITPQTGEKFTEFYLLGQNGTASNYPTDLKVGEEGKVIIGIVNHENENVTYVLKINLNGATLKQEQVLLKENQKWSSIFTFKAINLGNNQMLEFFLYKENQIEAYRTLRLYINVT